MNMSHTDHQVFKIIVQIRLRHCWPNTKRVKPQLERSAQVRNCQMLISCRRNPQNAEKLEVWRLLPQHQHQELPKKLLRTRKILKKNQIVLLQSAEKLEVLNQHPVYQRNL